MRINNNNPLAAFLSTESAKGRPVRSGETKTTPDAAAPSGAGQTQALIQQAKLAPDFRPQAVEDARTLLADGQLETGPSIQRLAERLTDFGI
ncbi:MAG: hypothetical protein FWE88_07350 [Phycisphaerae bacterium]|nr:hypothetical protein [Phycisphaerae bacterium]